MNLSKLKNTSKWFYAFLGVAIVLVGAIIAIIVISVNPAQPPEEDPPTLSDGPETGVYYYDVAGGEVLLSLNSGNKFSIAGPDINKSGEYSVSGETITLDFVRDEDGTATATITNGNVVLNYNNASMTFLKKVYFTVSFNSNDGSAVEAVKVLNGKLLTAPQTPTKNNSVFLGWYADEALTTRFQFDTAIVTADTTVYARWADKVVGQPEYTAKLSLGYAGAEEIANMETIGGKLYDLPTPAREGYTFAGWYVSMYEDGEKLTYAYTENTVLTANTTLFAVWTDNAATTLPSPGVSVDESALKWGVVEGASSYTVTVTDANGTVVHNKTVGATTETVDFASLPAGDYKIEVTAVSPTVSKNSEPAVRYFKNKALNRVSSFQVIDGMLLFNEVEGAEKYLITVECGNSAHKHELFDLGASTSFNFSGCPMQEGGIKFTVTAEGAGYASSVSETFVYNKLLAPIGGISYKAETDSFVWDAVAGAAGYTVTVTAGGNTDTFNIGNKTSFSVANYTGDIQVAVTPVTNGYNSPAAVSASCTKTTPATPAGLAVNGNVLTWDAVAGATSYEIKIGTLTYTSTVNSYDLSSLSLTAGETYSVAVKTIKGDDSSAYSAAINVGYLVMNPNLTYKNNTVCWTPVVGVTNYEVRVNGVVVGSVSNANSAKVVLSKAGINTIEVRYTDLGGSTWASVEVTAFEVTYKSRSLSGEKTEYVAIGDNLTLPTDFVNNGYSFSGWYNTPAASAGNGTQYSNALFTGNTDLVLYADWTPKAYNIEFQVDGFGINNVDQGDTVSVTYTHNYTLPVPKSDNPTYESFVGWFTGPSGSGTKLTDQNGNSVAAFPFYRDTIAYPYFESNVLSYILRPDNTYAVKAGPNFDTVSHVSVPYTYNGLPVSTILENAFASHNKLVSIDIPDTIKLVGTGAFSGTTSLTTINVYEVEGNHERLYSSYDGALIREDMGTTYLEVFPRGKTGSYTVPENVDVIADKVFQYASIDKVVISKGVTSILPKSFYYCSNLTTVEFEGGRDADVTVDVDAFYGCSNITSIKFPAKITEISIDIFKKLSMLTAIEVEEGGTRYGSVNGMLTNAIEDTILYAPNTVSGTYTVPKTVNHIGDSAFQGRSGLTAIVIPNHVLSIGSNAFADCVNVQTVTFEGNRSDDLNIGSNAFAGALKLRDVTFEGNDGTEPDTGAITIGSNAFIPRTISPALKNVKFEKGVNIKVIGSGAFSNQTELYNLSFDEGAVIKEIGSSAFENNKSIPAITIPATTTNIGASAFKGCTDAASVTFVEGGDEINFGDSAFYGCTALTKVELPSTVTKFNGSVFAGCDALAEIVVDEDNAVLKAVDGILYGIDANRNAISLEFYPKALAADPDTLATLPWDTLTTIGDSVFEKNTKVTEFKITAKLTYIGKNAFSSCANLERVTYEEGGTSFEIGDYAFYNCTGLLSAHFPDCTTKIGTGAFQSTRFTSFTMPSAITYIGANAFNGSSKLTSITIPEGVTTIGYGAFMGCSKLSSVTFKQSTTKITLGNDTSNGVFQNCKALTSINFKGRVTQIGANTFNGSAIAAIDLTNVTSIGNSAFSGATKLTSVYIPKTVTNIGNSVFAGCTALATIEFELGGTEDLTFGRKVFQNTAISEITLPNRIVELYGYKRTSSVATGIEVKDISEQFTGAASLKAINVEEGSTTFASVDGVLYETDANGVPVTLLFCPALNEGRIVDGEPTYELIIPNTVTLVENRAFANITKLTTITFEEFAPDSEFYGKQLLEIGNGGAGSTVTSFYAVVGGVYTDVTNKTYSNSIKEINLPSHLAKIAPYSFYSTINPLQVNFNKDAENVIIGNYAFGYSNLNGITLDLPGVSYMGSNAFFSSKLKAITFGKNSTLTTISSQTFNATCITEIVLPKSVETISSSAFYGSRLASFSVEKGSQLESIGVQAFAYMTTDGNSFGGTPSLTNLDLSNATKLTTIGNEAFYNSGLTSFTFPESVVSVGSRPFMGCKALTSITLSSTCTAAMLYAEDINIGTVSVFEGIENLKEIKINGNNRELSVVNGVLYDKTQTIVYHFPAKKDVTGFTLPNTVKIINTNAFAGFKGTTLVLPAGLESIEKNAFREATLESIVIPAGVKSIGDYAFYNCTSLASLSFAPNGQLESIGTYAFYQCSVAGELALPDSVKTIASCAFQNCYSITKLVLPAALETIDNAAFSNCTSLASLTIQEKLQTIGSNAFANTPIRSVYIPATVVSIGDGAFSLGNSKVLDGSVITESVLESVTFATDSTLKTIGSSVFNDSKIKEIVLPNSVTSIGTGLFKGSVNLKSVTLPEDLKTIPDSTFEGCTSLTDVTIPDGVTTIGNAAFKNSAIKEIYFSAIITSIGTSAFEGCANLKSAVFAENNTITELGTDTSAEDNIFKDTTSLETLVLPAGIRYIGGHVFENSGVAEVYLPATLISIGDYAFANCDNLTATAIYGAVTYLGDYAFFDCDKLVTAELSFGLEYLGELAFGSCEKLTTSYIPATVIKLGANPYAGCSALSGIDLDVDNKFFVFDEDGALYDASYQTLYYYPASNTAENVTIRDTVTEIAAGAFSGAPFKSITIPAKVGKINAYTFLDCLNLETVVIENGITEIGNHAFDGCTSLNNVSIPATALTLGDYAFANCTSLDSVTFDATVRYTIGTHFFDGCTGMTTVILPNNYSLTDADAKAHSLTSTAKKQGAIPSYMFANTGIVNAILPSSVVELGTSGVFMNCKDLESISFQGKLSYICLGNYYFYGCSKITEITIPAGGSDPLNNTIGYTFANCTSLTKVTINYTPSFVSSAPKDNGHMFENCTSLTEVVYQKATASSGGSSGGIGGIGIGGIGGIGGGSSGTTTYTYEEIYLSNIGDYWFAGCTSLETFTVANGANIGNYAFAGCTALKEFKVYVDEDSSGSDNGGGGLLPSPGLGKLSLTDDVKTLGLSGIEISGDKISDDKSDDKGDKSDKGDKEETEETAPKLGKLGAYAFQGCTGFTNFELNFEIPENVGEGVFDGWTVNETITLIQTDDDISVQIDKGMFKGCNATVKDKDGKTIVIDPKTGLPV